MNIRIKYFAISIMLLTGMGTFFTSCDDEKDTMEATSIELVLGDKQTGNIEGPLDNSIEVLVTDQDGQIFQNATVYFALEEGSVSSASVATNSNGKASVIWTLGPTVGTQTLTITALKSDGKTNVNGSPITVTATATSSISEVTDIDGNVYDVIQIGNQIWMAENLKATKYADNTPITKIEDNTEWGNLGNNNTDKAYCFYDNDETSDYGALYTWAAATNGVVYTTTDVQGVCPVGWHVPNESEWEELNDYLGNTDINGGKLKEEGTTHWESPNAGATNSTGFTALASGARNSSGSFQGKGILAQWWASSEETPTEWGYIWYINNTEPAFINGGAQKSCGYSVRCIKNK